LWPVDSFYYLFAIGGEYRASASVEITFRSAPEGVTHADSRVQDSRRYRVVGHPTPGANRAMDPCPATFRATAGRPYVFVAECLVHRRQTTRHSTLRISVNGVVFQWDR
jgi:hypothetical protein